jgi:polar amino acid transport system substrate-binding protein
MKNWGRILLTAIGLCLAGAMAHAQTIDDIIKRGTLRVGLDLADAPYGYLDNKMQPGGLDYDVASLAAKTLGVKLEIVQVNAASRIPSLLNGQADMMMGALAILATRAMQVWFTIPYSSGPTGVIAPASRKITSLDDLAGLTIGVVRGSTQDAIITAMAPPTAHLVRFDDDAASISALISAQVDATAAGAAVAGATAAKNPDKHIEMKLALRQNPLGIAVRRGNSDLLQWLNTFIFNIKYDGELPALHVKYNMPYGLPTF